SVPGDNTPYALVCVEEQDIEDPESCLAPELRLPLDLSGWYAVWVRTYRPDVNGGIDVRLPGEKHFVHVNPQQVSTIEGEAPAPGVLVDVLYRAADLTGQGLLFRQPYGTYDSEHLLANACLAGVRLVRLSDAQAERIEAERARADVRVAGYDNDGFSYFWKWGTHDTACIARLIEPLRDQSADFLNLSLGGLGGIIIPTPYTGMYQMTGHTRHGDYRANAFFRWCFENDINIVDVLAERAHEVGVRLFVALMMERSFSVDDAMKAHPEWNIKKGRGRWDYANPEVHEYQVKKIAWIMANHDIDGFVVDFTRYGHYFNEDEPDKFEHMNAFLRKLRAATDEVNAGKVRKVQLCASFADRSRFIQHWGSGKLDEQGLDVPTWIEEGLFDMLMPEGPTGLGFVRLAEGTRTAVWPRKAARYDFTNERILSGSLSPKQIERGVKDLFDGGAPGVFFFNHDTWSTFGRLGFREELDLRTKTTEAYGFRDGAAISFAAWYPTVTERNAQRDALRPLTIECDRRRSVDGDLAASIRNTFARPVTATLTWGPPGSESCLWIPEPGAQSVRIAPGQAQAVHFHVTGQAASQVGVPALELVLADGGQCVFRHRIPVRAVPRMVCPAAAGVEALPEMVFQPLYAVDGGEDGGSVEVGVARDATRLHVVCVCSGAGFVADGPEAEPHDSAAVRSADTVEVMIDTAAAEQAYRQFIASKAGGKADALWRFEAFAGHHTPKRDWNPDWDTRTTRLDDGFRVEMQIPFEALGASPVPGAAWRINVVARLRTGRERPATWSWASAEADFGHPRQFGVLAFE
ncbi:MAG: hypothetical protein JXR94_14710, partial [Candidatus Hydrogenedentes bacterium]|nr:hypothetical protein [Candidatus Hydrogenedentota bacterium]